MTIIAMAQLRSVLDDAEMDAIKTGMLYDAANTRAVALTLRSYYHTDGRRKPPIVVDPVCVSTSGHTLLETSAIRVAMDELFPLATLITPNKSEAELLLSLPSNNKISINSLSDAVNASRELGRICGCAILLKGGHLVVSRSDIDKLLQSEDSLHVKWEHPYDENMEILRFSNQQEDAMVIDILFDPETKNCTLFSRPRVESKSTHGTGCTLSAALACYLAQGHNSKPMNTVGIGSSHEGTSTGCHQARHRIYSPEYSSGVSVWRRLWSAESYAFIEHKIDTFVSLN